MHPPASITLRPARPQDARSMAEMSRDLVEAGLSWRYTPARMMALIRDADTIALLACDAQRIAGLAVMQFLDEHAHLNLLCVRSPQQRQGIGRGLMAWLDASARVAGIASITLELRADNDAARAFYDRLGYVETHVMSGYYEGRIAARRMVRQMHRVGPAR